MTSPTQTPTPTLTPTLTLTPTVTKDEMVAGIAGRLSPMGSMSPKQLGDAVALFPALHPSPHTNPYLVAVHYPQPYLNHD